MPAIHPNALRRLKDLLHEILDDPHSPDRWGDDAAQVLPDIERALRPSKMKLLFRASRTHRDETQRKAMRVIRPRVWERSDGACEACGHVLGPKEGVLDHILGGNGRRRAEQRVETCWRLCSPCNEAKTLNRPSALSWWNKIVQHLRHHEYWREAAIAEARVVTIHARNATMPAEA